MDAEHLRLIAIQDQSEATIEEMWQYLTAAQRLESLKLARALAAKKDASDELRFIACVALVAITKLYSA